MVIAVMERVTHLTNNLLHLKYMTEGELKKGMDEVYAVGFKHGQIEMRNKILKSINRDYGLLPHASLMLKLMKKINRLKLSKKFTKNIYN